MNTQVHVGIFPKARSSCINLNAAPEAKINKHSFYYNIRLTVHRRCSTIWPSLPLFSVSIISWIFTKGLENKGLSFLYFLIFFAG